jgi:hypothetical protein
MSAPSPDAGRDADARHARAVVSSLRHADRAAERGDHADALGWLRAIEACGDSLPEEYAAKQQAWRRALRDLP